jgi:tetratricopeptide (TPR) repeat protein
MKEERIARLKEFLEQDPNDSFSRYALALEHAGRGETQVAIVLLQEVIQRDPAYVAAYQQLGYNYASLGNVEDARTILHQGIAKATEVGDNHARSEMQEALDELA